MVNFGILAAEIVSLLWGTPANFNGLASWQHYCTVLNCWASAKLFSVEQRAPPIFSRAAITLGIGPHFSFKLWSVLVYVCAVRTIDHCCAKVCDVVGREMSI